MIELVEGKAVRALCTAVAALLLTTTNYSSAEPERESSPEASGYRIRDVAGVFHSLRTTLRERWRTGGGTAVSGDGKLLAFSVSVEPSLDEHHRTVESPKGWAFGDGTPNSRRGNRLMVAPLSQASSASAPTLISPFDSWYPAWSPDSRRIAYLSNEGGKIQLWLYDVAAAKRRLVVDLPVYVRPLSTRDYPCWSRDGTQLFVSVVTSFVRDGGKPRPNPYFTRLGDYSDARSVAIQFGNPDVAASSIAAVDVESGKADLLPGNGPINLLHTLSVSPSGRWLAALTDDYQLSVISLPDRRLYPVGRIDALPYVADEYGGSYWSPVNDTLTYLAGGRFYALDLAQGFSEARQLAPNFESLPWHFDASKTFFDDNLAPPAFTRDGRNLVGLILLDSLVRLVMMPLDGGAATAFPTRAGRRVSRDPGEDIRFELRDGIDLLRSRPNLLWQPDLNQVYLGYTDDATAETVIDAVDLRTGAAHTVRRLQARMGVVGQVSAGEAIILYEDFRTPGNLFRLSGPTLRQSAQPLVNLDVPASKLEVLRRAQISTFVTTVPTREGGLRAVRTAVIRPGVNLQKVPPAVVSIYPGANRSGAINQFPDGQSDAPIPELLASGYAVVLADILGVGPWDPTIEQVETRGVIDSLLPQLYQADFRKLVDIRRLAVLGYSQGGHAAVAAVTGTNLFRAAVSINGVRFAPTQQSVAIPSDFSAAEDVDAIKFATGLHQLMDNSPYLRAGQVRAPVLLFHGQTDPSSRSSILMSEALRAAGRKVELVLYPDVGHVLAAWPDKDKANMNTRLIKFLDAQVR